LGAAVCSRFRGMAGSLGLVTLCFVATMISPAVQRAGAVGQPPHLAGPAATPLMGWSSWSTLRTAISEVDIKVQARALAKTLAPSGYRYVNLDDGWYVDPGYSVDPYGRWLVDQSKFPHGMKALGDYLHGLGLKFGLYITPGIPAAAVAKNTPIEGTTCHARDIANTKKFDANYQSATAMYAIDFKNKCAQAFIDSWARQFASWGVDFLKLDGLDSSTIDVAAAWSHALRSTGRPFYLALANTLQLPDAKSWKMYGNSWRIDSDIECYTNCNALTDWNEVLLRFTDDPPWVTVSGNGGWTDLDSLDVGNGHLDGLTKDERQTYMTLWAISAAPLYTGDDLTQLDSFGIQLLTNKEIIGVDQAGVAGHPLDDTGLQQVWFAKEPDGSYAVALFNLDDTTTTAVTLNFSTLGITARASVRDLWHHTDLGTFTKQYTVSLPPHGSSMLRVKPVQMS